MAEGLQLQVRGDLLADLGDLPQGELPRQNHPLGAQVIPGLGGDIVADGLLGGDVALTAGRVFPGQGKGAQIGEDQGVHPSVVKKLQIGRKLSDLVVAGHGIHGHVDADAVGMGIGHGAWQRLGGKIPREGAHAEGGTGQVHRVGAVGNCQLEPL